MVILLWLRQNDRVLAKLRLRTLLKNKKIKQKKFAISQTVIQKTSINETLVYTNTIIGHCIIGIWKGVAKWTLFFLHSLECYFSQLFLLTFPQWTRFWLESYVKLHYPPGPGAYVFFIPDVASHELTVNMQDGHASQAKCCWAEESPGKFYQLHFRQVCGNSSADDVQLSKVFGW